MKTLFSFLTAFAFLAACSCGKSNSAGGGSGTSTPPSNLNVSAIVSTDNSGNVAFTATATNATSFDYDYGNGIFATVQTGVVTYQYPFSGTYTVIVTAKSATGQTISKSIQVIVTVALGLVWSDEFNTGSAPDPAKWGYDLGAGGWGNNELQHYTNRVDNVIVSGGTLKIIAKKESYNGSAYTSARMLTKDKFSFKYGKVEFSAKLPAGVGTWPAVWSLGSNFTTVGWPACGEIDFMEHKGSDLNRIYGTLHYPGRSGGNADGRTVVISNASTAFHKYTTEWTAAYIKFSVDDVPFFTFTNNSSLPFNHNFFLIMNVAMGGSFGGTVDSAFVSAQMEIDYIRVYQ